MPAAGERTRTANPVPPADNPMAVATATAMPAQTDLASPALPVVRTAARVATRAGAASHASGLRVWRSPRLLSFIAVVIVPAALAAAYLFGAASDQYVAEFRFTLSSAEAPRFDPASLLAGITAPAPPAALESQILVQYIGSRAIVDRLDTALDLRRLFSPPQADWWSRLSTPATIERLVWYWKGQVDPAYDATNGTVTVRVRAFDPGETLRLAEAVVASCEALVNELSLQSRRDALAHANVELAQAEDRLKTVLARIRVFRDREGLIDPARAAEANGALTARPCDAVSLFSPVSLLAGIATPTCQAHPHFLSFRNLQPWKCLFVPNAGHV